MSPKNATCHSDYPLMEPLEPRLLLASDWTGVWNFNGFLTEADTDDNRAWLTSRAMRTTGTITQLPSGDYLLDVAAAEEQFTLTENGDELRGSEIGPDQDGDYRELLLVMKELRPGAALVLSGEGGFDSPDKGDLWWSTGYAGLATKGAFTPTPRPWTGVYDALLYEIDADSNDGNGTVSMRSWTDEGSVTPLGGGKYFVQPSDDEGFTVVESGGMLTRHTTEYDRDGDYVEAYTRILRGPDDMLYAAEGYACYDSPQKRDLYWVDHLVIVLWPQAGSVYKPDLSGAFPDSVNGSVFVAGDKLRIPVTVTNSGNAPAKGKVRVNLYVTPNGLLDGDERLLGSVVASLNLKAGGSQTISVPAVFPQGMALGPSSSLLAQIDADNAIAELDEDNNEAVSGAVETAWKFGNLGCRKGAKLTLTDADGTVATFSLTGAGTGCIEPVGGDWSLGLVGTDMKSTVTIATTKSKAPGDDGEVDLSEVGIVDSDSLGRLNAPSTNLRGPMSALGGLGTVTLGDVDAGGAGITIGSAGNTCPVSLTLDRVTDTFLDSAQPIKSLTATEWLDTDGMLQEINAPWLGNLSIVGKTTMPKIAGDCAVNVTLSSPGVTGTGKTLSSAIVKGSVAPSTWDIEGPIGSIAVAGTVGTVDEPWQLVDAMSLGGLTLADVINAVVTIDGESGAIKAKRWLDGSIQAARVGRITMSGAPAVSGDFAADVTVTGAGKTTLTMAVAGWLDGAAIASPNGPIGSIALGGIRNSTITAGDDVTQTLLSGLTVKGMEGQFTFINSTVSAWTLGTISVKGVQTDNGHQAHGITGNRITTSYTRDGKRLAGPTLGPTVVEHVEDYLVELV